MKILFSLFLSLFAICVSAQKHSGQVDSSKKVLTVDASCGQCKFGLEGKGCSLAVRIDSKAYFVDGTAIDSHGDAHADDGFCNAIRKAKVQGRVVDNRFKVNYFELLPEAKSKKTTNQ